MSEFVDDDGFRRDKYGRYIPDGDSGAAPYYVTIPMDEYEELCRIRNTHRENDTHVTNALDELMAAVKKHPVFCGDLVDGCHDYYHARMVEAQRRNDTQGWTPSAEAVIMEEIWELLEAIASGDWVHAYKESAQVVATLFRLMGIISKESGEVPHDKT